MDWIVGGMILVASLAVASLVLDHGGAGADRCPSCGTDLEITDQGMELVRLGLVGTLPAACPVCGATGAIELGQMEDEPWAR